jgi:hypothetical protein
MSKLPWPTLADKTIVERKGDDNLDRQVADVLGAREKKDEPQPEANPRLRGEVKAP